MVRTTLLLGLLMVGATAPAADGTVAEGFAWLENQCFDGRGNLFFSDSTHGEVWRLFEGGENRYHMELVQSDFQAVMGLAVDEARDEVLAVVVRREGRWLARNYLVAFRAELPSIYRIIASLPSSGNGLVVHDRFAYISSARSFLPEDGVVYRVDIERGSVDVFAEKLTYANGLALDVAKQHLYVGEWATGAIQVFDLATARRVRTHHLLKPRDAEWLDDMVVDSERGWLYGTDFAKGRVVAVPLTGEAAGPVEVAAGLKNPTSVAFGRGTGFRGCSLYVTEGGGLTVHDADRRLVEVPHVRCGDRGGACAAR
ncbi:SMP-30/gluconolactonase/LRE family protein [Acanthopleuribacter pedis]|uniref:SMP-30/gluconolactonase/LRE family protein n=1 Tax=Acanthopleuribacter pedis TaxID=442870 RepID=A0A8J7Q799_9BACT|nr:SMP-30/gluconolactonase/LRE family protein [Acanthopleuribacter pedis]MBO1319606.1 SMP-30/gluconolactonase/LRE family protein [Acanthopleuribacter pedis]